MKKQVVEERVYGTLRSEDRIDKRRYKLVKPGTNEDVLGGEVTRANVYLSAYPEIAADSKLVDELQVGEHAVAHYRLSGSKGTYWIVRVR